MNDYPDLAKALTKALLFSKHSIGSFGIGEKVYLQSS